ncbi:MAG: hypothetical protein Q7S89_02620 [bacterium]|nr:hypothetical protein [bacterium]
MRRLLFIILIVVVVAAALIGGGIVLNRRQQSVSATPESASPTADVPTPALPPAPVDAPRPFEGKAAAEVVLAQRARSVAERYGSYSTDQPFANLLDLSSVVSERLWAQFETQMKKKSAVPLQRVVVVAVGVETLKESETERRFRVPVQRTTFSAGSSKQSEGKMVVVFVQEGGAWKVDAITWE